MFLDESNTNLQGRHILSFSLPPPSGEGEKRETHSNGLPENRHVNDDKAIHRV